MEGTMTTEVAIDLHGSGLRSKTRKFVIHFAGDAADACKKAGYTPDASGGYGHHVKRLMSNLEVIAAIKRRDQIMKELPHNTDPVMDVAQLRQWWTSIVTNTDERIGHRIKCSQLLAQSYGAFIERIIVDDHKQIDIQYSFQGPMSNFLKSREDAAHEVIDVTPEPLPISEQDYVI